MNLHLESVYGTSSCLYDTVCWRIRRFQSGKKDLRGAMVWRKKPAMNEGAIERVRHAIADDQHISIQEITEICYLSRDAIYRIIHEEFGMKKVCAKWVASFLTCAQHVERVRCATHM